jgi:RNA 2',3'-cyclic 3'-phosphodiesterase
VAPRLWIGGGGRFGGGRSTTLWTGIRGDIDALRGLAGDIRQALRAAKLPFDTKPMRPHVTLARPGDRLTREQLDADLAALNRYEGPKWTADAIELVRSHIGPHVQYDRLASWTLADLGNSGTNIGA